MRCLLALSALFCSVAAAESPARTVTVLVSGGRVPGGVLRAMEQEAQSDLAPSGLKLSWVSNQDLQRSGVNGTLTILRVRGECRPGALVHNDSVRAANGDSVLGQTHIVDGKVLPIADILCDSVQNLVGRDLKTAPPGARDQLLGRALGRVAAHELYHILAGTTDHARRGLSRPEQRSNELLAPEDSFSPQSEQRIADSVGSDSGDSTAAGR